MVRITLFFRRNLNTMAFTARLFMLLAIAVVPIMADETDELPEEFPALRKQNTHINEMFSERYSDSCPPFGHPDNIFNVTVLGTISPEIGGCASMVPLSLDIIPSFNLWLGSPKTGGGHCGDEYMDHYVFECKAKYPFITKEDKLEGWHALLYDRTARWTGRPDIRCALYKTVSEDPPIIQMVISGNNTCSGLSKRMEHSESAVPEGLKHSADGSIALLFWKNLPESPMRRKKRSEEQGRGCRFPDWSQGSWTNLKVDENLARYEPAHEKDDVDFGQENDDGKDGNPETTGGEHYMQRSQRHALVGISGIDNSSTHDSRSHRGRPSVENWRCEMAVDNDVKQLPQFESGAKFLTYGGSVVENYEMTGNDKHKEQDSKMTYGCLWLVPRGSNILEFSIIGTGMPSINQSMQTFARQLCSENHAHGKDTGVQNERKLRLRRPLWVTETRTDDKKRVPVRCPVPPGIVFYGVVAASPPPSTVSTNKDQLTPLRLCAKLVSSADDCTAGQMGPADQMKYTVSECVDQDFTTGTSQTEVAQQAIFEEREYQCIGQWTEPQQHISPVAGEKPVMLTYTYLKRLSPVSKERAQYECFVGTPIPNDDGLNPETTTTILLTEAGTNTKCSRLSDPYRSGIKLVGTKIKKEGACKGSAQPVQDTTGGSWYSLKPQLISPSIPGAENGGGAWYASPPVPVISAQDPKTMTPILTGGHTASNGTTFTSQHNEQNRHPQTATIPPKINHSFRTVADKRIVLLAVILFTTRRFFN